MPLISPREVDEVQLAVPHDLLPVRHALLDHDLEGEDGVAPRGVLVHEGLRRLPLLDALPEDVEDVFRRQHLHLLQPAAHDP